MKFNHDQMETPRGNRIANTVDILIYISTLIGIIAGVLMFFGTCLLKLHRYEMLIIVGIVLVLLTISGAVLTNRRRQQIWRDIEGFEENRITKSDEGMR